MCGEEQEDPPELRGLVAAAEPRHKGAETHEGETVAVAEERVGRLEVAEVASAGEYLTFPAEEVATT